jgi:hypothetical protein
MAHCLAPVSAFALVGVGFLDGMQVREQANLACAHLCDNRADCSVYPTVDCECSFSWAGPEHVGFDVGCPSLLRYDSCGIK